ncbi:uncharacterized protein LOC112044213 [Bicyclus anynana]|uniref:Uncharacterized protein LOC112044213 n=1 Tax=Bicyclus anynana TaxID=110368 RepID=A0A6J1MS52_BICAN|nr:uncharacterized protein LOC112044213 [Bicyclus anynana]
MQLINDHSPVVNVKERKICDIGNINTNIRESFHDIDKEKMSSDAALFLMNPVASGDNMLTDMNSGQKLKEELAPLLVPCCEGKELRINEELVRSGLSAISVKQDSVVHCMSTSYACEKMQVPAGLVKHRNSFRCLHRPDLKRVPYLRRMTPDELETLFRGFADLPVHFDRNDSQKPTTCPNCAQRPEVPNKTTASKRALETTTVNLNQSTDDGGLLHPIPETKSCAEDVPAGMRLHGARARLYTSVLAGAKTGDQLDNASANEEYDTQVPNEVIPEDEIQFSEELQIILPPRCDDVTADSSTTSSDKAT